MSQHEQGRQDTMHTPGKLLSIPILQGEYRVSGSANTIFTTVLGSCIATCLSDPRRGIGGMNHFLLAGDEKSDRASLSFGINAMELLVNELLKHGARRERLQAKIFGGGQMIKGIHNIGSSNTSFAKWFLENEGIRCVGESVGGTKARKLRFWPHSGHAQQQFVDAGPELTILPKRPAPPALDARPRGVTLF